MNLIPGISGENLFCFLPLPLDVGHARVTKQDSVEITYLHARDASVPELT